MVWVFLQSFKISASTAKTNTFVKQLTQLAFGLCTFPNIMEIVRSIHMLSQCQTIKLSVPMEMLSFILITAGGWMWYSVILLNSHDEFIISVGKTGQHLLEHQSVHFLFYF